MICDEVDGRLTLVRHLSKRHDLMQQNSKGPNIRLDAELVVVDGFGSGPLHREFCSFFGLVHIIVFFLEAKTQHTVQILNFQSIGTLNQM